MNINNIEKPTKFIIGELLYIGLNMPARIKVKEGTMRTSPVVRYLIQKDGRIWIETAHTIYWLDTRESTE